MLPLLASAVAELFPDGVAAAQVDDVRVRHADERHPVVAPRRERRETEGHDSQQPQVRDQPAAQQRETLCRAQKRLRTVRLAMRVVEQL